ncbi:MAG: hypothetical protein COW01_00865 [Bdellovibrionales bacterium CG12_big_fil_rev_8_21_14_0_65_38_15]|nr:MAG: hypothetical protein COW79_05125 [Bdellovibrionales bacterium CG22_combo_CG10-13_8_21_14_all_38_13]PIQ57308.1 MAG: hypothetical protein COW01_00865 [Bdellovibrionales bacterium CG12_big_fil_rev_8_21_14_0_65_38_15]PIR28854.1 MAG: hypothetical protein COV38_13455 [Bdellovibrionales bacterium CG11_big_fil_rev_8_21_14_0_20_38_13]
MIRASIDIGSNSVLLIVAELDEKNNVKELANESRVTALGRGLSKSGVFSEDAMKETYLALKDYVELSEELGIDSRSIIVTATEASRVASNAEEFFERIINKLNIEIKVISGSGEAYYTALGVCRMAKSKGLITIVDIGGASTEIMKIKSKPFQVIDSISLPVGSVRATDWIEQNQFDIEIKKAFDLIEDDRFESSDAIFVAGTMTSIAAIMLGMNSFEANKIGTESISFEKLGKFINCLKPLDNETLLDQYPILGKRSKSVVGGGLVALSVGHRLKIKNLTISPYGLRYGTLIEGSLEEQYVERHFRPENS